MSLSPMEIGLVLLVALLLFGPGRIAGVGKGLGEGIRSFRRGLTGLEDEATTMTSVAKEAPAEPAKAPP